MKWIYPNNNCDKVSTTGLWNLWSLKGLDPIMICVGIPLDTAKESDKMWFSHINCCPIKTKNIRQISAKDCHRIERFRVDPTKPFLICFLALFLERFFCWKKKLSMLSSIQWFEVSLHENLKKLLLMNSVLILIVFTEVLRLIKKGLKINLHTLQICVYLEFNNYLFS